MRNLIDIKLLLIAFVSFIFVTCNSEDVIDDIANETANDDIVGASLGKYQQLNFEEALFFVNEIKPEKPSHEGDGLGTLNASSDFLVGVDANSLVFEDVENTKHKIPTLKAQLKNPQVESTAFLVKVQDSVLGFLINAAEDKSIGDEKFSGIVGITDLSGNFVNGYRLKNGEFVSQFVVSKDQKSKDSVGATKRSLSFTAKTVAEEMPRWDCWIYSDSQLDEVSVYGKLGNISNIGRRVSNRGVSVRGGSFSGPTTGRFGAGGGGTGSSSGSDPSGSSGSEAEIFPCDDPLHGCDTNFAEEEDDKIFNKLTGKALCVYEKLRESGTDFTDKILNQFKGDGSEFDVLIISEEKVFSQTHNKFVNGITSYKKGGNQIKIFISTDKAKGRSVLSVARTLIHEYVHADMFRKLNTTSELTQEELDFKTTYEKFKEGNFNATPQHETMAELYVSSIAEALKEFHKTVLTKDYDYLSNDGAKPLSDNFYQALAWQGLKEHDVQAYLDLTEEEKAALKNALQTYYHDTTKNCQKE